MVNHKVYFRSEDGVRLCGVWEEPEVKTDKAIILAHGITVDKDESGIFVTLAEALVKEGFAVFRFDFRGHGESEGTTEEMTIEGELMDMAEALRLVEEKGYAHIALLAASFGGGIGTLFTADNQERLRCLCLWDPVLNYEHTFLNPTLPWIRERKSHMKSEIESQGWTTLGSRQVKVGKALFEQMEIYKPYEALKEITLPLVIIHGDKDTKVPYEDSKEYVTRAKNGRLITIEGAEHGFHEAWERKIAIQKTVEFITTNIQEQYGFS
jgi:uncharacterized protein